MEPTPVSRTLFSPRPARRAHARPGATRGRPGAAITARIRSLPLSFLSLSLFLFSFSFLPFSFTLSPSPAARTQGRPRSACSRAARPGTLLAAPRACPVHVHTAAPEPLQRRRAVTCAHTHTRADSPPACAPPRRARSSHRPRDHARHATATELCAAGPARPAPPRLASAHTLTQSHAALPRSPTAAVDDVRRSRLPPCARRPWHTAAVRHTQPPQYDAVPAPAHPSTPAQLPQSASSTPPSFQRHRPRATTPERH